MQIVYAKQSPPVSFRRALFLAGPTPREGTASSWRPRALQLLQEMNFDGVVFVPEKEGGGMEGGYEEQIEWEETCLNMADCIVFWIPRELKEMPGFTTNVEWGFWEDSLKAVLGAPQDAPKMRYLRYYAEKLSVPQRDTLEETLAVAVERVSDGALRSGGEREVPLHIWRQESFQAWYASICAAGNRLDGARVRWQLAKKGRLFCWALQVSVFIPKEDRHKRSEVIIARPDISAVLAYYPGTTRDETQVLLVKEFRSPGVTSDGFLHELPSGSTHKHGVDPRQVASDELFEETGLRIQPERMTLQLSRQSTATLLSHKIHLYSVEMNAEEYKQAKENEGKRFGEHDSERTYPELRTLSQLRASSDVDWSHVGMIFSVL
jgi:8-oxo-dGTP pyrophosphatase MutT (NUDIX family)